MCNYDAYQIFALMVVLESGIKFGCLMYFMALPKESKSGRLGNMCSVGFSSCKCWIDTPLTFLKLSWTSKALSEIFSQIWKLHLHLEFKVSLGVWFLKTTVSPILKFALLGSLMGVGFYLVHFQIQYCHHVNFLQCLGVFLHFSSPIYPNFGSSNLNKVGIKGSHPNIR